MHRHKHWGEENAMVPDANGEWVRWSDVMQAMEEAQGLTIEQMDRTLSPHPIKPLMTFRRIFRQCFSDPNASY